MSKNNAHQAGRHFLQIPGPSNVPDRVLRAIAQPTIDHRGPEFAQLTLGILDKLKSVFNTESPILIYPASGTGGWESSLLNTLCPGDKVLAFETGHFATLWKNVAVKLGLEVIWVEGDWRQGIDADVVEQHLLDDQSHEIKAVLAVHTETSSGATSDIAKIRKAIDAAKHPALYMVDAVSSLACTELRHDDWGIDVTISASQKGLMLPPGLCFNSVSEKALAASKTSRFPHSYWSWDSMLELNKKGYFPYTPSTNILYGLDEALCMLHDEGMTNVFARHLRLARATQLAVAGWGLENLCANSEEYSNSTTAVLMPEGHNADVLRNIILERFNMSLGMGLGKVKGTVFRIGHIGDFNELMLAGTLSGVEMGLNIAGVPHKKGGVNAALEFLASPV
ncbi:MAG: aminotransferase class V-fold PLP-dependent enzyme [Gammaproteobacteria bacterium]|jgi:alanine-glyoxylate transaminase/serine-glyoxylate transaminase/serine-pyruvate transaminase|nr:aminotransferase class V-fold PLP-dependent enzyme [Gammaproteobacteria bacterium]